MSEKPDIALLAGELRVTLGNLIRRLREHAPGNDLTKSQTSVLLRLEREGPATATALARAEGMRPQSMAKIVHVLQAAGLVTAAADPSDGRKTLLSISDTALEDFRTGRRAREDWLSRAIDDHLTDEEIVTLARSVELIKRLVQRA